MIIKIFIKFKKKYFKNIENNIKLIYNIIFKWDQFYLETDSGGIDHYMMITVGEKLDFLLDLQAWFGYHITGNIN